MRDEMVIIAFNTKSKNLHNHYFLFQSSVKAY